MRATVITDATEIGDAGFDRSDLVGVQSETIQLAVIGLLGLAFAVLAIGAFGLNRIDLGLFGSAVALATVSIVAHAASKIRPLAAAGIVVVGSAITLSVGLVTFAGSFAAPWFVLVVLVASALLGWRWGAVSALATTVILVLAALTPRGAISVEVAANCGLLAWASLGAAWLISRPSHVALDWAWASYGHALENATIARERQAESIRLTKSLGESYYQLEQLNLELERVRQSAEEARRLKAQFAAAVSHELRTPLNLIIGFCEMMVLSPSSAYGQRLPRNYQEDLEAIYRNAGHISALVDDILDLSQIDADRMALHKDWTTLEHIVGEAVATVETLFREKELYLRTQVAGIPSINVDQTRIRQILINLLSNAARFLEQGGVTVTATREEARVVIAVRDTGPGIPAAELPGVFEEFYQVGGMSRRRSGSGLGLTVSKRFAELHGGRMWVESVVGEGSTFFLELPLLDQAPAGSVDGVSWDERVAQRVRGDAERRILVLDEVGQVHKVFLRYLDNYRVLHATSIEKAQKLARSEPVRGVVLGTALAEAAWREVGHLSPELASLPIFSCTLSTTRRTADELGVADYLVKPVSREQLRSALRRLGRDVRQALIVDDDPEMSRLLGRMVRTLVRGCQVRTTDGGEGALAELHARRPDVLILDLLMPGLNGYEVVKAMRADSELADVPVLVVTARGLQEEAVVASALTVRRAGGLSVAEIMRWIRTGLDAVIPASDAPPRPAPTPPTS